jgi:hypothetical protein
LQPLSGSSVTTQTHPEKRIQNRTRNPKSVTYCFCHSARELMRGEVNMSMSETFLFAYDKIIRARFPKNKRFDRSHMTVGRPIP